MLGGGRRRAGAARRGTRRDGEGPQEWATQHEWELLCGARGRLLGPPYAIYMVIYECYSQTRSASHIWISLTWLLHLPSVEKSAPTVLVVVRRSVPTSAIVLKARVLSNSMPHPRTYHSGFLVFPLSRWWDKNKIYEHARWN